MMAVDLPGNGTRLGRHGGACAEVSAVVVRGSVAASWVRYQPHRANGG